MSRLYLREANKDDIGILYQWANEKAVRKNSFHSEPITFQNHVKWFDHMMSDSSILQYIMMEDEVPVGQIRLSINGDEAEIGYSIAPEYRGKGYGKILLDLLKEEVKKNRTDIKTFVAKVKPDNIASQKVFEKEGFIQHYLCYKLACETDEQ